MSRDVPRSIVWSRPQSVFWAVVLPSVIAVASAYHVHDLDRRHDREIRFLTAEYETRILRVAALLEKCRTDARSARTSSLESAVEENSEQVRRVSCALSLFAQAPAGLGRTRLPGPLSAVTKNCEGVL